MRATPGRQLRQDRAAQQELAHLRIQCRQDFIRQVLEHMPFAEQDGSGAATSHAHQQPQPCRPAARALCQLRCGLRGCATGRQQIRNLLRIKTQIVQTQLGHFVPCTPTRKRQIRSRASGNHQTPVRHRHALQQETQQLEHAGIPDAMRIVDDDHATGDLVARQGIGDLVCHLPEPAFAQRQCRKGAR